MLYWSQYIAASLRLIDLVDSTHDPGAAPIFNREERKGREDSLWIEIGILLLEYLREQSAAASHDFVSIAPFVEDVQECYPNITEKDIQYVCAVLSTPCLVSLPEFLPDGTRRNVPTKQTNLIEQLGHGKRSFRLASTGQLAISLATNASDLLYAEEDAAKILKALQYHDFVKFGELCNEIRSRLIESCHEIRRALSRPGYDEIRSHFMDHRENYQQIIKNVQETVRSARNYLNAPTLEEIVASWQASNPEHPLSVAFLRYQVSSLNETLEVLGRTFAKFIEELASQTTSNIGLIDFAKLSRRLVQDPISARETLGIWKLLGPCASTFVCADTDIFRGCLRSTVAEKSEVRQVFDQSDSHALQELPSALGRLLERYGEPIVEQLRQGPLPLKKAMELGFFLASEDEEATFGIDILGVYMTPERLGLGDTRLGVGVRHGGGFEFVNRADRLSGDELVFVLVEAEGSLA
jgi:hypothetical protein